MVDSEDLTMERTDMVCTSQRVCSVREKYKANYRKCAVIMKTPNIVNIPNPVHMCVCVVEGDK